MVRRFSPLIRPSPVRVVSFTRHAIDQAYAKFPAVLAICTKIGAAHVFRHLEMAARCAKPSPYENAVLGKGYLDGTYQDQFYSFPISFFVDFHHNIPVVITCLTRAEVAGAGGARLPT